MRPGRLPKVGRSGWGFIGCQIEGCQNKHYSKHLCKNHFEMNRRFGRTEYKYPHVTHCLIEGCLNNGKFHKGYCGFHYHRLVKGRPLEFIGRPNKGEKNCNWKGGIAEYPNHSEMKRVRLQVLEEANYTCQYCGKPTNKIHHKDFSKDNHKKENLAAACQKCNSKMRDPSKPCKSKYRRLYGHTLKELAEMRRLLRKVRKDQKNGHDLFLNCYKMPPQVEARL